MLDTPPLRHQQYTTIRDVAFIIAFFGTQVRALKDALAVATAVAAKEGTPAAFATSPTTASSTDGAGVANSAEIGTVSAAAATGKFESDSEDGRGEDDKNEAAARLAKELETAERELENLKEREKDAMEEAGRTNEELERFRCVCCWTIISRVRRRRNK